MILRALASVALPRLALALLRDVLPAIELAVEAAAAQRLARAQFPYVVRLS